MESEVLKFKLRLLSPNICHTLLAERNLQRGSATDHLYQKGL
jgi:hypothetical protein